MTSRGRTVDVTPSARRLTGSLRDIGYDFVSALADLVDNSIAANASEVNIEVVFDGAKSHVLIADNGDGMTESQLTEALRFGSRREYELGDLGRYGLGLKTASISQCRRVTVISRRSLQLRRLAMKTLDIDHIARTDRWEITDPPEETAAYRALKWLLEAPGTVVLWENLDRVLPGNRPEGGWARRRLESLASRARDYLGMVFHRFIEGATTSERPLVVTVNGEKVAPWNPFGPLEDHRQELPAQSFEVNVGELSGLVTLRRYLMPPRHLFSSVEEFERLSGPLKWNRQQGFYIYRADRLIQYGGWSGIRAADEHTKLARASVDFQTDLDALFQINVAKMRVLLPVEVRTLLERPIHELCHQADALYRRDPKADSAGVKDAETSKATANSREVGTALMAAALDAGEYQSFTRVMDRLRELEPDLATSLGW